MDVLKVVQQLRDLAADPQNRATIVRDQGCLPGLVIFLDNDNPHVVGTALEALYYLAQVPSNKSLMKNEVGLLLSVNRIISRSGSPPDVKSSAQRVHDLLIPPAGSTRPLSQARSTRGHPFLGASNKRAKVILLQIDGLRDQESRRVVEETFLGVKGVISFTFNMSQRRCSLRVRSEVRPDALCHAVERSGSISAKQVIKNEQGEEVLLAFAPSPRIPSLDEKENTQPTKLPDYLPEDNDESHKDDEKAIERSGAVGQGGGWFSSVSSFLTNSFYW
ncbi:armadillo repeat-containing protein 1-like [Halichondria panicea]|uniref:armadillo repeat-containing protein 1-like n=1 Tax=Halichondria panicea TaxID=6063 RepID=UPI00312B7B52